MVEAAHGGSHCSVAVSPEECRMSRCSAVFALATLQFTAEGVDEGVSERSTEFGHHCFHVARVHDHSPLPVTLLASYAFHATGNLDSPHCLRVPYTR